MKSLVTQVTEALDRVPQIRHTVTGYQQGGSNLYLINVQCNPRRVLYTVLKNSSIRCAGWCTNEET